MQGDQPVAPTVRKIVTVLFCDLVGSTPLAEAMDAETYRQLLSRYFERMTGVIDRHHGKVEKFVGDAIVAMFGVPKLHEDDALRAVRAAVEMRGALSEMSVDLQERWNVTLHTRTAINTGEVALAGSSGPVILGDVGNVAARLQEAAAPAEIVVAAATYELVKAAVRAEPLEPLGLKGKSHVVRAFRVTEVIPGATPVARDLNRPMVGRDLELQRMIQAFDAALESSTCQVTTVVAAPGLGKTRLLSQVTAELVDRATVLHGSCLSYGEGITYWPIIEILKQAAAITPDDAPSEAMANIRSILVNEPQGVLVARFLGQLLGFDNAGGTVEETFWAVRKLFETLARQAPLVVIIEDIHWAEATLLDLIEHLRDWLRDAPVAVFCSSRPELLDERPRFDKPPAKMVFLEPLDEEASVHVLRNVLHGETIEVKTLERLMASTRGNPLFIEQTVSLLREEGRLYSRHGRWTSDAGLNVPVPPSLQALLAARLEALSREERQTIEPAAVVGEEFSSAALKAAHGVDPLEVAASLRSLVQRELVQAGRWDVPRQETFRFRHALIRETVYQSTPKQNRAQFHENLGAWMEREAGDRIGEYEEIVGYHLEQACRYRRELGEPDDVVVALARRAADHLFYAGRRTLQRDDFRTAFELLRRALDLYLIYRPPPLELIEAIEDPVYSLHDVDFAKRLVGVCEAAASDASDRRFEVLSRLIASWIRWCEDVAQLSSEGANEAQEIIRLSEEIGYEKALPRAWNRLTSHYQSLGQEGETVHGAQKVVEYARRTGDISLEGWGRGQIAWSLRKGPTHIREALEYLEEFLTWSACAGKRVTEAIALFHHASLTAKLLEVGSARARLTKARELFEDLGMAGDPQVAFTSFSIEIVGGDLSSAEHRLRESYDVLIASGHPTVAASILARLAELCCMQGRHGEAHELAPKSKTLSAPDDYDVLIFADRALAKVASHRGDHDEAVALARRALKVAQRTEWLAVQGSTLVDAAEVLVAAGRRREALDPAREAVHVYDKKGHLAGLQRAQRLLDDLGGQDSSP